MKSRFEVPSFAALKDPPSWVREAPPADVPKDAIGIEVFSEDAHLHIVRDEDTKQTQQHWTVRVFIRSPRLAICELASRTDYRRGDTPKTIEAEYAVDIARYIASLFEEELL